MTEQDYFGHLEMRVTRELAGMRRKDVRSLWCDGFLPETLVVVDGRLQMMGDVWVAFGRKQQELWRFVLDLGAERGRQEIEWAAMLPGENLTGWLSLDFERKCMRVMPTEARADNAGGG